MVGLIIFILISFVIGFAISTGIKLSNKVFDDKEKKDEIKKK